VLFKLLHCFFLTLHPYHPHPLLDQAKLADFPQGAAGWATFRAKMEVEVDEMAKLASKPADVHHGHGHDEEHGAAKLSPAEEFEAKYGRSLDAMTERMAKYKSDPKGFLESSILDEFGQKGLDVWKKSESFSAASMSEADKATAEQAFASFLNSA
jgi:di/tripeptidase